MNRLLLIIVAMLCMPAFTESIQACECREYRTPICARFWRSDAVFVGQVVDIKPLKRKPDDVYTYVMSRFMVQESFRGVPGPIVGVGTATNTLCEPKFKKGKRYLVYTSLDDKTNQLFAGMCNGTTLAVDIDESLKELRKLAHREVGESISGLIKTRRYQGLPGIAVEVTSNDKTFKTMTTKYGEFSISLPSPGSFKVRVSVPYAVQLMDSSDDDLAVRSNQTESGSTFEYDVILEKSQCSYLELDVYGTDPRATGTVAGNVLTATEQAVDKGAVSLINEVDTGPDYVALLKTDGSFRFERVAPGEYHLVLNARHELPEEYDAPYARTYFPATTDKRQAKKIQVVEGAVIENLAMHVGPRMTERIVAGTVVWKGGRPLESAHISVYSGNEYVRYVSIDEDGRFNCILYGDYDYSIDASDYIDEIEGHSQRKKIPQGNSTGLRLVIQRVKR
jgi:hypothetical protein